MQFVVDSIGAESAYSVIRQELLFSKHARKTLHNPMTDPFFQLISQSVSKKNVRGGGRPGRSIITHVATSVLTARSSASKA
jgi:hypothetical protein